MRAPRKRSVLANLVQYQTRYGRRSVNVVGQICAKHPWHSGGIGNARCSLIKRFENPTMSMKRTWASSNSVSFVASLDIVFIQEGASLDQCEGIIGLKLRRYPPGSSLSVPAVP